MSILRQLRYVHMYVGPCRYLLHEFMRCTLAFGLNKFCQVSCSTHTSSCVHVFIEVSQLCPWWVWWLAWCLFVFSMVQVFTMFGRVTCSPRRCLTSLMICDSSHEMVEQNGHRKWTDISIGKRVCCLNSLFVYFSTQNKHCYEQTTETVQSCQQTSPVMYKFQLPCKKSTI